MQGTGRVGILGAGAMGSGIAQVAATAGHPVTLVDQDSATLARSAAQLEQVLGRAVEKGKMTAGEAQAIAGRIHRTTDGSQFAGCALVIEAIVEQFEAKSAAFRSIESWVDASTVLATNTSSLSVTGLAGTLQYPERFIGLHFFNPAPLMPLVEVIPALQSHVDLASGCMRLMEKWGKRPVWAKDSPGFIVNRVARPFYGEALRIYEEGMADMVNIDAAMTELGFRMGPFELMDFIGNDVNYAVTASVFEATYFDPRYRPSLTQKRHVEAGFLGRKTGRGYYSYAPDSLRPAPAADAALRARIGERILAMLINEAHDAVFMGIASVEDVDTAMTLGVNYPRGLHAWTAEQGAAHWVQVLDALQQRYQEDRYRVSPLLRQLALPSA